MIIESRVIKSKDEWNRTLSLFDKIEIYSRYEYFNLYSSDYESPILFYIKSSFGEFAYPTMLIDLSLHPNLVGKIDDKEYYDISSHYGYSGPLISVEDEDSKYRVAEEFYSFFGKYCRKNNIISEFIKFSPILKNHSYLKSHVDLINLKKTLVTDLKSYGDPLYGEFTKSKRRDVRKRIASGIEVKIEVSPSSLEDLLGIYYQTMDRHDADRYFYFSREYFNKMLDSMSDKILFARAYLDGKLIGFELCFIYGGIINSHIGGTADGYMKYSPSDLICYEIVRWGREHDFRYYHAGGGTTSDPNDSLYLYKKAFAKNSDFDFYIGKNVWNNKAYQYLKELSDIDPCITYFPIYRYY